MTAALDVWHIIYLALGAAAAVLIMTGRNA